MNINEVIFTNYCFGPRYIEQQERLQKSIYEIYPNANLLFKHSILPPGARPFLDSLYGLKVHAIQECRDMGFSKVIWLDTAIVLGGKIDLLSDYPIVVIKDDNRLHQYVSDKALAFWSITREQVESAQWNLVGGSMYYFDFSNIRTQRVFLAWKEMEEDGLFGSQREEASGLLQGGRHDESAMALSLYMNGVEPIPGPIVKYQVKEGAVFSKFHFK